MATQETVKPPFSAQALTLVEESAPVLWFLLLMAILFTVNFFMPLLASQHAMGYSLGFWRVVAWLVTVALSVGYFLFIGLRAKGRLAGLVIDRREMVSLAKVQSALWSAVIFPGLFTALISNAAGRTGAALGVKLPGTVLAILGISLLSLAGRSLIITQKERKPSRLSEATNEGLKAVRGDVNARGSTLVRPDASQAKVSDIFYGDEPGNGKQLDLGKIQLFYLTVILVLAYAVVLGTTFASSARVINEFPELDANLILLLTISHAGYLTTKAVPRTP